MTIETKITQPSPEQEKVARDIYKILTTDRMARGEKWPREPNILGIIVTGKPVDVALTPEERDKPFRFFLESDFKEQTSRDWDPEKYALVSVPYDEPILGPGGLFVVFEREILV